VDHTNQMLVASAIKKSAERVLDFILPARCANCSTKIAAHGYLCPVCWGELHPLTSPFCHHCALPFEFDTGYGDECGACLKEPPAFDWARAAVTYDEMGRSLVLRLKHAGSTAVVPAMAQMMALALADMPVDIIMPVPLHKRRMLLRRFNQSQLLSDALAVRLGLTSDNFSLRKKKATQSQGGLGRKARFQNVRASFEIKTGHTDMIKEKDIVLVDDVLTTGATASACAKILKKAGAKSVGIITFARVGQPIAG